MQELRWSKPIFYLNKMNKAKGNSKLTCKNIINLANGVQIFQDILKKQNKLKTKGVPQGPVWGPLHLAYILMIS